MFPELGKLFTKVVGRTSVWVLGHAAIPGAVLEMGVERLTQQLRQASRGQLGRERAEAMVQAAWRSVGVKEAVQAHQLAIGQLLDELEELVRQLTEVQQWMATELERVPYARHLLTVPGFGPITVAILLGEFGDLREYRVAKQLIKMAGLDLVENSSGERQGHHRISRRGRRYARQILYMAALTAGRLALSERTERRRRMVEDNNKPARKVAVANACALLRISHALVRDGVDFDATRYAAPAQVTMAA